MTCKSFFFKILLGVFMEIFIAAVVIFFIFIGIAANSDNTSTTSTQRTTYNQPKPITTSSSSGLEEDILFNIGALGSLLAKVDGHIDDREIQLIYTWIRNEASSSFAEKKISSIRSYINKINQSSFTTDLVKKELNKFLRFIKNECSISMKYSALQLYVDIIIVDKKISKREKNTIFHIAKNLGVDMEKFLDSFHDKLPQSLLESAIDSSTLGLSSTMSIQEKKKILRDQYRKWSDLVTSDDEKTRRKAELMLKIISQERSKLKEKNSQ